MNAIFAALLSLFVVTSAQADFPLPEVKTAELTKIIMGGQTDIVGGSVSLDLIRNQITLSLQPAWSCPEGRACATVMPQPIEVALPIVSYKPSFCGTKYIAMKDEMPVDGAYNKIVLTDWSFATCEIVISDLIQVDYTVKYYDRIKGQLVEKNSYFAADSWK